MKPIRVVIPGLVVLAALAVARPATAQLANQVTKPVAEPANQLPPPEKLPPGIPGSATNPASVAPIGRVPSDMSPNQALFDAVNRGDITSARDALNRGADVDARNVLGMTPLDAAIDLGRNDISFLLLSMRGTGSNGDSPPQSRNAPAVAAAPVHPGRAGRATARIERVAVTAAAPTTAPLFANDGGAPVPQVGFLGFGGRSH